VLLWWPVVRFTRRGSRVAIAREVLDPFGRIAIGAFVVAVTTGLVSLVTQLGRVAALELAPHGIRVNMLHPHAVFDTGAWSPEVLEARARHYGTTVEEYKKGNLLKVELTSRDVAALVCAVAGPAFRGTTGAQIPIDGGSDRVI